MIKAPLVDPNDVENFNRSLLEKEAFFFFTIFVAGKTAKTITPKAQGFHQDMIDMVVDKVGVNKVVEYGTIRLLDCLSINEIIELRVIPRTSSAGMDSASCEARLGLLF